MRIIYLYKINTKGDYMKKRDLEKLLAKNGFYLKRHGADHDIFTDGKKKIQVPRHKEINELLAKSIIKKLGLK